ncbi:MAG TPA: TIR domain-containing protein, partial [Opitutaceae bacterium]
MAESPLQSRGRAVFLSYAHEDAEAARRIADALRGFGVEVWFDSNELRGGDHWDAKIRGQIKACGLFMPIVSQTTQTRREAYFRLEWKLADDRTHLLAPGTPFLVPVVIDHTPEYEATVPESFAKAQWTRLPGGEPTPEFVAQVKKLATQPATAPLPARHTAGAATRLSAAPQRDAKRGTPHWLWLAGMGIVAITVIAIFKSDESKPERDSERSQATAAEPAGAKANVDRRSIAVLPFTNMSEDAAASSFFADGVHEDLLTNLAFIGDLRVVSRTSVMQYRNTEKSVRQIAAELGVGSLLEGSVRRSGDRVRVTAQLIDASTDEHLWAQTYDRKVEDIFAIQGELAKSIAAALKVALSSEQEKSLERRPTENIAAYELFLQERELVERDGNTPQRVQESIGLMQRAVALDPQFALAWANLGVLHAQSYFWFFDRTQARLDQATAAIEKALALAPGDLDVKTYAGSYYYYGFRNYAKAAEFYNEVLEVAPNHVEAIASLGFIRRREGRWRESIGHHERALEIDPRNVSVLLGLGSTYSVLRHFDKAADYFERLSGMFPTSLPYEGMTALYRSAQLNSDAPLRGWLKRYDSVEKDVPDLIWSVRLAFARIERSPDARRLFESPPTRNAGFPGDDVDLERAHVEWLLGARADAESRARGLAEKYRQELAQRPADLALRSKLFTALCLMRDREGARAELDRIGSEVAALNDAFEGNGGRMAEAQFLAWFGTPAECVAQIREALRFPGDQG